MSGGEGHPSMFSDSPFSPKHEYDLLPGRFTKRAPVIGNRESHGFKVNLNETVVSPAGDKDSFSIQNSSILPTVREELQAITIKDSVVSATQGELIRNESSLKKHHQRVFSASGAMSNRTG